MTKTLNIIIPAGGWATRMRPQTWSKPKPLVSVAGKAAIEHLLDSFRGLPADWSVEYTFIIPPHVGEQIPAYLEKAHPGMKCHYYIQHEMKGQSHAILLASDFLRGPTIIIFSDTLIETDFSFLAQEEADAIAWVKHVPDPRRFGVAIADKDGTVSRLKEKPEDCENTLVVVGCYYFKQGETLASAIKEQIELGKTFKNEFFLTEAINICLEGGARMRTHLVETWLDVGTIDATLETNRYLLAQLQPELPAQWDAQRCQQDNLMIVPPVYIDETAELSNAVIGPHVSLGSGCKITNARIEDSILESGVVVQNASLKGSFIGRSARIEGGGREEPPMRLNVGDNSQVILK